ncbi:RNA polymerase II elongation factor ELL-like [Ylistrum balloti]|uniref:RNA polymerase II elongation factor ELL-like n=1 Tax=Ylistrum balloti TaxID=509963 RepID=UPI002905E7F4|nr:RNA polymerase II elongation factor ELL-like [Ylistrum balloti]
MAALAEGRQYGLSSSISSQEHKTVVQVKLTDSALKSIDEFLRIKVGRSQGTPTIQFQGQTGIICIPSNNTGDPARTFQFSLAPVVDSNTSDCAHQPDTKHGSHLNTLGTMSQKIAIHATSDVFQATKQRMNQAIADTNSVCTQEIKPSGRHIGRKIKRVKAGLDLNTKLTQGSKLNKPSVVSSSHSSQVTSVRPSSLHAGSRSISPYQGSHEQNTSKVTSSVSSSSSPLSHHPSSLASTVATPSTVPASSKSKPINPAIVGVPMRDRIIHLLALRPYKKPELLLRLKADGILDKDKDTISSVLQQVAVFIPRDNKYSLARHAFAEVRQDWKFYSENDKELVKKKLDNLSPASSPASNQRSPDSPNNSQKRPTESVLDLLPSKKQRISHSVAKPRKENKPLIGEVLKHDQHLTINGHDQTHKKENIDERVQVATSTSDSPDYMNTYHPISTAEQRQRYKQEFNHEYEEYRGLHMNVERVSKKFMDFEAMLKRAQPGSESYENLKNKIRMEYKLQKSDVKYIDQKKRFDYLHKKLGFIKQLILEYDHMQTNVDS